MNFNNLMDVMIPIFFSDRWEQIFNFLVCFVTDFAKLSLCIREETSLGGVGEI